MKRDFTYIDDVVTGIINLMNLKLKENHLVLNIGKGKSDNLMDLVNLLQNNYNKKFKILYSKKIPIGDIKKTFSNTKKAKKFINWKPKVNLKEGIKKFVDWYKIIMALNNQHVYKKIIEILLILLPIALLFSNIVSEIIIFTLIVFYLSKQNFEIFFENLKNPIISLILIFWFYLILNFFINIDNNPSLLRLPFFIRFLYMF